MFHTKTTIDDGFLQGIFEKNMLRCKMENKLQKFPMEIKSLFKAPYKEFQ